MRVYFPQFRKAAVLAGLMLFGLAGCHHHQADLFYSPPPPPEPLGTVVDDLMWRQEENAEASKYVIYQHEFKLNKPENGEDHGGYRLNEYGEDHVKRIAEMLRHGIPYPVVIERSQTGTQPGTEHEYPVHFNPQLDLQRRDVVCLAGYK